MDWHHIGNKPLPELMTTQFTDVYLHLPNSMSSHTLTDYYDMFTTFLSTYIKWPTFWYQHVSVHSDEEIYKQHTGIILCMRPANERRRYNVTSSLIGWVHSQDDPWTYKQFPLKLRVHWYAEYILQHHSKATEHQTSMNEYTTHTKINPCVHWKCFSRTWK